MAYNIRKGWPDDSAIDEQFVLKASDTTVPGMIFKVKNTGGVPIAEAASFGGAQGTGSIATTVFTDTTHASGAFAVGQTLTGAGILPGTKITALATGTGANNGGTYTINLSQTVASTVISGGDLSDNMNLSYWCFDNDTVTNKVMGLISGCVIEMDATHYVAGAYVPNAAITASAGKVMLHAGDGAPILGRVLAYNGGTNILRVLWTSNC